jgi:cadmium resistance protein CadD (predicted permease)
MTILLILFAFILLLGPISNNLTDLKKVEDTLEDGVHTMNIPFVYLMDEILILLLSSQNIRTSLTTARMSTHNFDH